MPTPRCAASRPGRPDTRRGGRGHQHRAAAPPGGQPERLGPGERGERGRHRRRRGRGQHDRRDQQDGEHAAEQQAGQRGRQAEHELLREELRRPGTVASPRARPAARSPVRRWATLAAMLTSRPAMASRAAAAAATASTACCGAADSGLPSRPVASWARLVSADPAGSTRGQPGRRPAGGGQPPAGHRDRGQRPAEQDLLHRGEIHDERPAAGRDRGERRHRRDDAAPRRSGRPR